MGRDVLGEGCILGSRRVRHSVPSAALGVRQRASDLPAPVEAALSNAVPAARDSRLRDSPCASDPGSRTDAEFSARLAPVRPGSPGLAPIRRDWARATPTRLKLPRTRYYTAPKSSPYHDSHPRNRAQLEELRSAWKIRAQEVCHVRLATVSRWRK